MEILALIGAQAASQQVGARGGRPRAAVYAAPPQAAHAVPPASTAGSDGEASPALLGGGATAETMSQGPGTWKISTSLSVEKRALLLGLIGE